MSRTFVPPQQQSLAGSPAVSTDDLYQYAHVNSQARLKDTQMVYDDLSDDDEPMRAHSSELGNYEQQNHEFNAAYGDSLPFSYTGETEQVDDDKKYRFLLRVFLAVSVISAALVMGLEAVVYVAINLNRHEFDSDLKYFEILIFLALFIFASVYQVFLTIIALKTKNMMLLLMLCVFYACMLIYTGIQYQEVSLNEVTNSSSKAWRIAANATNIAAMGLLGLTLVVQLALVYFLKGSVRWFSFKKIGASVEIKKLYMFFQIHRCLLVFDFFFFLAFTVQFIVIMVADETSLEFILTCCMLPLTILVLFISDYAATRELLWLSTFSLACFLGGCVYVLFKTIRLFTKYTSAYNVTVTPGSYFPGRTSLVMFAVITLIFLFLTIGIEVYNVVNYKKGLLPYVNRYYGRLPLAGRSAENSKDEFIDEDTEKTADNESMLID